MARDAEEEPVELLALLCVKRREELVFDVLDDRTEPAELALALGGQNDAVAAPVLRVAAPLDQPTLLEAVEQADELAPVELEGVGDRGLCLGRALRQQGEDAVVVEARARGLQLVDRPPLDLEAEAAQHDDRARDELERQAGPGAARRDHRAVV